MILAFLSLIGFLFFVALPVGGVILLADDYIEENIKEEDREEFKEELMEYIRKYIPVAVIPPIALIAFLIGFPKIVSSRLLSGNYNCMLGICKNKARTRRSNTIFINHDSFFGAFSNAINKYHYRMAQPGDEILMLRVLWMRYAIVKQFL